MNGIARRPTLRRTAVVAMIVAAELGSAEFAIGVTAVAGPGLTTVATVSINGATGTWAPIQPITTAPAATPASQTTTASPTPTPDQPVTPAPPVVSETTSTTAAATGTASAVEPTSPSGPGPTTGS